MKPWMKWTGIGVAGVLGMGAVGLGVLWRWAGSDDFRARAEQAASQAVGVPVALGRIELALLPLPGVAVHDVRVATQPPLTLRQVEARPAWGALLAGRPQLDALVVREAQLPQQGLLALAARAPSTPKATPGATPTTTPTTDLLPRRILLRQVTWVDAAGRPLTVDADIAFAGEPLPQEARIDVVGGRYAGAKARLLREPAAWQLRAEIGGGTVAGPLRLQPQPGGAWRFGGELAIEGVEVSALTAPARTLTGRLQARSTLSAEFREPGELAKALRTQTRFTVRNAVIHGVDLAQAVRTLGISRSGNTALDTLSGDVATRGPVVQLSNLVASSGMLAATGQVTLQADRQLAGRVDASLGGALGVPLAVGGTLDQPSVTPAGIKLPGSDAAASVGKSLGDGLRGLFGR